MEDVNSNDGDSRRITGLPMSSTVKELKQSIVQNLNNPQGWDSLGCAYGEAELSDRRSSIINIPILRAQPIDSCSTG
jgi:hypothetical protein